MIAVLLGPRCSRGTGPTSVGAAARGRSTVWKACFSSMKTTKRIRTKTLWKSKNRYILFFKFRETILHHRFCQQVEDEDVFIPPDGGYGWFVALGAFIAFFFSAGIVKSYGVILDSILLEYEGATVSQAAWIPVRQTLTY